MSSAKLAPLWPSNLPKGFIFFAYCRLAMEKFFGAFAVQTSSSRCTIVAYSSSIVMTEIQANGELAFKSLNAQ
jgi:hypothetical protein